MTRRIRSTALGVILLALGGCSFLDHVEIPQSHGDNKILLGDGVVRLSAREIDRYSCGAGAFLQCEIVGGQHLCRCAMR